MTHLVSQESITFEHGSDRLTVSLHRTLRIPEDGRTHALPPSLGLFPLRRIEDYRQKVPAAWREHGGVFFPMWQREAMWLSFHVQGGRPFAVKVATGKVNAVSGERWEEALRAADSRQQRANSSGSGPEPRAPSPEPLQDYLVCPPQPWLDGFNSGAGKIRQFVAMPLGLGYTVEGQVTGKEDVGGLQLLVVPPKDGRLTRRPQVVLRGRQFLKGQSAAYGNHTFSVDIQSSYSQASSNSIGGSGLPLGRTLDSYVGGRFEPMEMNRSANKAAEMGLAQGGEMVQKIYPDPHGIDVWKQEASMRLFLHIVNSELYEQITGEKPPPSPITAQTYAHYGYPWYELWDQEMGDAPASGKLAGVKTVGQMDQSHGFSGQQDDSLLHEKVVSAGSVTSSAGVVREGKEW